MAISVNNSIDINRMGYRNNNIRQTTSAVTKVSDSHVESEVNLLEEITQASEEIADLVSIFGRFSKAGRRNDINENDFTSAILEEKTDEKINLIVKNINKFSNLSSFLNFARSLFPNDSDLMLVMRELLNNRMLSEFQKKKIKEAISDIKKYCDTKKMQSGINIGNVAKKFVDRKKGRSLSSKDLRNSYLRFIEIDVPASFIYQDWINEFGSENRTVLLAFTLSSLISDIKSSQPGIHFDEFGKLSSKLSDARVLNSLDRSLFESVDNIDVKKWSVDKNDISFECNILNLYMIGLTDFIFFKKEIVDFGNIFTTDLPTEKCASLLQKYRNTFNITPDFLYSNTELKDLIQMYISSLMQDFYGKHMVLRY